MKPVYCIRLVLVIAFLFPIAGQACADTTVVYYSDTAGDIVRMVSRDGAGITLEMRLSRIRISASETDTSWVQLQIPGFGHSSISGWPELPQTSVWIERAAQVRVTLLDSQVVREKWGTVQPAPEPLYRSSGDRLTRRADETAYRSRGRFPAKPVHVSLEGSVGASSTALLTIDPVQYEASSGECIVWKRMLIRVEQGTGAAMNEAGIGNHPAPLLVSRQSFIIPDRERESLWIPPRLLIVSESQFLPALAPLVAWKQRSGVPTMTLRFSDIASDANSLQQYLLQYVDSAAAPPQYLLIVGDVEIIPAFYGVGGSLTDHPYGTLTGNDYLPDISVGRVPCRNVEECRAWVSRVLSYERDAVPSSSTNSMVFSSAVALDPAHGIYVSNLFRSAGWSVDQLQQPHSGSLAGLMSSLNGGKQWLFYIGHGYPQAWSSVTPSFTNAQVSELIAPSCPVIFAVACATADFDFPNRSLGEFWHDQLNCLGPVAYFGATENTPFFRSDTLAIEALRAMFLHNLDRLGVAADYGRLMTAQCFPQAPGGLTEETIQQFELLGDPSMRVFWSTPQPVQVDYPSQIPLGEIEIPISVMRAGAPQPNAEICLADSQGSYYAVRLADSSGLARFPVGFTRSSLLSVTVTASNSIPFMGSIHVVPNVAPYIEISQVRVIDQAGDNDGLLDRGESASLMIGLHNAGSAGMPGGNAKLIALHNNLRTDSTWLTVPALLPGQSVWLESGFPLLVNEVADGEEVLVRLLIRSGSDTVAVLPLGITVHAPRIGWSSWSASEFGGDGDGRLEDGEAAALSCYLSNSGSDHARNLVLTAWTASDTMHFLDSTCVVPAIAAGDSARVSFIISSSFAWRRGARFEFGLHVRGDNVTTRNDAASVRIGRLPVLLYVLDAYPQQVEGIVAALQTLGVEYLRTTSLPSDLAIFSSIWIFSGMFPNAVPLPAADAARIAQYLNEDGNCYWEGGDVWAYDPVTALHPYFRINGLSDGTSNAGPIVGAERPGFAGLRFDYMGENNFVDQLGADSGATIVMRSQRPGAHYAVAVAFQGTTYCTYGTSVETGALCDMQFPNTRVNLLRLILVWFGIEIPADILPPVIIHHSIDGGYRPHRPIVIGADIQDDSGIRQARIAYGLGGLDQQLPLQLDGGWYRARLPAFPSGSTVWYQIEAQDASAFANMAISPRYVIHVGPSGESALDVTFSRYSYEQVANSIRVEGDAAWCITEYPQGTPVLELSASEHGSVSFTTESVDVSVLDIPILTFWASVGASRSLPESRLRVSGSIDGGRTFPLILWEKPEAELRLLQEGSVILTETTGFAGANETAIRFELQGPALWRLNDIRLLSATSVAESPVTGLVISPGSGLMILRWPPVPDAHFYRVEATESFGAPFERLGIVTDTLFADSNASSLTRFYRVMACSISNGQVGERTASYRPMAPSSPLLPDLRWNRKLSKRM